MLARERDNIQTHMNESVDHGHAGFIPRMKGWFYSGKSFGIFSEN